MAKEVTGLIKLQVPGGQATPAPPVGPALGQHGVNIGEFVQRFNAVVIWASDNPMKRHSAPLSVRSALLQALVDDMADHRLRQDTDRVLAER